MRPDQSSLSTRQAKEVLKVRALLVRLGHAPASPPVQALTDIILAHIKQTKKAEYVSSILGPAYAVPVRDCYLFDADGLIIEVPARYGGQAVGRYIVARFRWDGLPWAVKVIGGRELYL